MTFVRVADWFGRSRALLALASIAITAVALYGVLRIRFDDVPQSIYRTADEDFALLEQVSEQFGTNEGDCVLVVQADDLFTPAGVSSLIALVEDLRRVPNIAAVESLADIQVFHRRRVPRVLLHFARAAPPRPERLLPAIDAPPAYFERARREAAEHPLVAGQLLSADGRSTLVVAKLDRTDMPVTEMEPVVARLHEVARRHEAASGFKIELTGLAPIRTEILGAVRRESEQFVWIGVTLAFGMSLVLFRRLGAVLIVGGAAMLGAAWTMGSMGLVGEPMTVITTVLPTLVMVIGFTDAVHLLVHFRKARSEGHSRFEAAKGSISHLGLACLLASITTAIGFGSLWAADADVIQRFGLACAAGALITFLAVLLLVPLLCSTRLGDYLHIHDGWDLPGRVAGWLAPVVAWVIHRPRRVTAMSVALTVAMLVAALQLRPSSQINEALPSANEASRALRVVDSEFGGTLTAQVLVEWPETLSLQSPAVLSALGDAQRLLEEHPRANSPISVLNLLAALPGEQRTLAERIPLLSWVPEDPLHRFVRADLRRAVVTMRLEDLGSSVHAVTFNDLRRGLADIQRRYPDVTLRLTGSEVLISRNLNQMIVDLALSLGTAAVIIFGIMAIGFRCLRLGLISVVPNLFPLVATAALLVATGQTLQMTSVIVFSVCLGIAVNDTIHFIHRFQSELKVDGNVQAAILRSFHVVGAAMITTTVVFMAGFASILISEMPTSRLFAMLSCSALAAALVGDLLILPAMLACFVRSRRATLPAPPHNVALAADDDVADRLAAAPVGAAV